VHDGPLDPGVQLITKPFTQAALSSKLRDIIDASEGLSRILLVEDEPLIRLATEFLEEGGFKVDTAGTATEAMNKLNLRSVSLTAVIVDIGLPDRSGDALGARDQVNSLSLA
jgi:ActR/RegA family two-component response regulator